MENQNGTPNAASTQADNGNTNPAPEGDADDLANQTRTGGEISNVENDETRAPEEEAQSQIPGDPRPVNQLQPPTKEQY